MSLTCGHCQQNNREESFFCAQCGMKLHFLEVPAVALVPLNRSACARQMLSAQINYLGRDETNHMVLADASVSKRHAKISFDDGQFYLEDVGSVNGTFLNGERVAARTRLRPGDLLRLGTVILRFESAMAGEAA
jgi:pSer/pThr/pTyr-binding forkhead associated (FHA) protein